MMPLITLANCPLPPAAGQTSDKTACADRATRRCSDCKMRGDHDASTLPIRGHKWGQWARPDVNASMHTCPCRRYSASARLAAASCSNQQQGQTTRKIEKGRLLVDTAAMTAEYLPDSG
jgi:hypothetical protein